jgi:hypothetical protein
MPRVRVSKNVLTRRWYADILGDNNKSLFTSGTYRNLEDCLSAARLVFGMTEEYTPIEVTGYASGFSWFKRPRKSEPTPGMYAALYDVQGREFNPLKVPGYKRARIVPSEPNPGFGTYAGVAIFGPALRDWPPVYGWSLYMDGERIGPVRDVAVSRVTAKGDTLHLPVFIE